VAELAFAHDALLPQRPGGQGAGAALALVVHAGLVAALTLSVDWRAHTPEVFSAELWASVPQPAAPPAPPPPAAAPEPPAPPPRTQAPPEPDADIAIERERESKRKQQAEDRKKEDAARKLAEADKKKQVETDKKKAAELKQAEVARREAEQQAREAKAEDERLALLREENLKRMMGQVGGSGGATSSGTAAQSAGPSADYGNKVIARVRPNIVFTGTVVGNQAAEVEVTAASGGSIIARRIVKSSGHKDWDEAVLRAIDRTPALPRDTDGRVPQTIIIAFRRE